MEDRKLDEEYRQLFDNIHASEDLKRRVLSAKPKKRNIRPIIAAAATAAAAFTIFAAVHDYDFTHKGDGVISTVTVQTDGDNAEKTGESAAPAYKAASDEAVPESTGAPEPAPTPKPAPAQPRTSAGAAAPKKQQSSPKGFGQSSPPAAGEEKRRAAAPVSGSAAADKQAAVHTPAPQPPQPDVQSEPVRGTADETADTGNVSDMAQEKNFKEPEADHAPEAENADNKDGGVSRRAVYARRGALLKMNSYSLMPVGAAAEQQADIFAGGDYHTDEWDNSRYFDYIGTDILKKAVLPEDFVYSGAESMVFTVNSDGVPLNDTRIFAYTGSNGRYVGIITSRDSSYTQTCLSASGLEMSEINGTCAVVFQSENSYSCCMLYGGASVIVNADGITEDELAELLLGLTG